jgi:predicted Co/Zn/Cd cation transporter (cation efflux family)
VLCVASVYGFVFGINAIGIGHRHITYPSPAIVVAIVTIIAAAVLWFSKGPKE